MYIDDEIDRTPNYLPIYRCPFCKSPLKGFNGEYVVTFICPNASTSINCGTFGLANFNVNFDRESRDLVSITFKNSNYQLYVSYSHSHINRQNFSELRTVKWTPMYKKSTSILNELIFTTDFVEWSWHSLDNLQDEIRIHATFT